MKSWIEFNAEKESNQVWQIWDDLIEIVKHRGKCPVCGGYVYPGIDDDGFEFTCTKCHRVISGSHEIIEMGIRATAEEGEVFPSGKALTMMVFGIEIDPTPV